MDYGTTVAELFQDLCNQLTVTAEESESFDITLVEKMSEESQESGDIDFSKPWTYADIVFVVEDKRVYANKMILSMWSPVFQAMFSNNFREKTASEIKLPGKTQDDVMEMMRVLHPPNKDISDENVLQLLPLAQEYQMEKITYRCEDYLMSEASSIKNYLIAQKYSLKRLEDSVMGYLRRAPVTRLKSQPEFESLEPELVIEILMDKCMKFESNLEALREVRMVLERKKPTMFPGMHLLCDECTQAREQQVNCDGCMRSCCKRITDILRAIER